MESGSDHARVWRVRRTGLDVPASLLTALGALFLLALAVLAAVTVLGGPPRTGVGRLFVEAEDRCEAHGLSCALLSSIVMPSLTLALATVAYLLFRFTRVRGAYRRKAYRQPRELVETAGGIFGDVVGRDQLCSVLMEDLRVRRFRRAHVVVGGVGAGKTALMVLLTERLARRHAIPVPLRLRDADRRLDFGQLAFERFCREVQGELRSSAEGEKVWRRLRQQDRIVVLADGLEEALLGEDLAEERDTVIRLAIRRANEERLPLIIASRPHEPLRAMEASLTVLEPLSEEAALSYIGRTGRRSDRQRLDWIVETASIAEAPTYLQIARELHQEGLLEHAVTGSEGEAVETRGGDRAALRFHLLDSWISALISGRFHPELSLSQRERQVAVDYLSALACVGLGADSSEVRFADVVGEQRAPEPPFPEVCRELARRIRGSRMDIRLAATWGMRVGLVEVHGDRVRFQHSVMQAHLGARFMNAVIRPGVGAAEGVGGQGWAAVERTFFPGALEEPGRELLIAMVLHSRTPEGACTHGEAGGVPGAGAEEVWCPVAASRDLLLEAARQTREPPADSAGRRTPGPAACAAEADALPLGRGSPTKVLELYTAALEIDSVDAHPRQHAIAMELCAYWPDLRAGDPHTLYAGKARLVARFGEAMRVVDRAGSVKPAYLALFEIGCLEPSYAIRTAIAQEIGAGGDAAFAALRPRLRGPALVHDRPMEREPDWREKVWEGQQPDGAEATGEGAEAAEAAGDAGDGGEATEEGGEARRSGAAEEIGGTGGAAGTAGAAGRAVGAGGGARPGAVAPVARLRDDRARRADRAWRETLRDRAEREAEERMLRDNTMCAWLVPLLVGSVSTTRHQDTPYEYLESWVRRVGEQETDPDARLDLSLEAALAQGFKYAANRRHRHPHARPQAREYLAERAWDMMRRTTFWFSRLTLLHALTLWALPDEVQEEPPERGHGSDPAEQVRQWLARPEGVPEHPFVEAAAELAVWALRTRRPERFLWIDESGVAAQVGSQTAPRGEARKHNLWIPPSCGWSALHPQAQQLLADVLLLLNLAERGDRPKERLRCLKHTDRPDLPPCLTRDRDTLDPGRTVVRTAVSHAGSNCRDDCAFELCPYPPRGTEGLRAELSGVFCRSQSALLSRSPFRRRGRWLARADTADLRAFWERMAQRAQDGPRPR
ncbi:NACHT domain-containing protein [Allostreptomyces psammosilenae]|uniref:NACHT domain-containing protein n=1 Tax=Allostreptomyces psammosilenae TaxID=1892865 RepID=A0A853A2K0_9ACTN|nr:NACHT domain-containing protein [Allostreptomyces psammosilenae]NYI07690.1 hypothetical protein [Allostreptomyces psammosilenae]